MTTSLRNFYNIVSKIVSSGIPHYYFLVNTTRSCCNALACMEFLVSMISTQMVIDAVSLMFPETSCKEEEDIWDHKVFNNLLS